MKIAVYAFDGITMFHLSVPQMVFGEVARQGLADWETVLFTDSDGFTEHGGSVRTVEGYGIDGLAGSGVVPAADIVVVPSWFDDGRPLPASLAQAIRQAHGNGAMIVGLCLGAFPVADSGLLGTRPAVTHWHALDEFSARHPDIPVDRTVLYIDHGDVLTSAGTAAAMDACLHIVRSRLGAEAANRVARSLVVAPHRSGGQAQYIERPVRHVKDSNPIAEALDWAVEHLGESLGVDDLAQAAHMSRRSFIRAFRAATGTTPATWLRTRRLDEVRRLLEITDLPIEQIAAKCGFTSPVTMRQNFMSAYATTPSEYRRLFNGQAAPA